MFKIILPRILRVASLIFAPCVLFMNLLIALATGSTSNMLKLLFVFIILVISVLISTFVVIFNEKKSFAKRPIIYLWFMTFSVLFIIASVGAIIYRYSTNGLTKWNLVSMLILLAASLIYSISHLYIKFPSPFSYIYRYFLYGVMLYTCVVSISGYGTGTSNVIIFGIYTFIFFLTAIFISISKHKKKEKELEKEEYENQFS